MVPPKLPMLLPTLLTTRKAELPVVCDVDQIRSYFLCVHVSRIHQVEPP